MRPGSGEGGGGEGCPLRRYGRFSLEPREVRRVETLHRTIVTPLPVPESIPVFEALLRSEPLSMSGQPPVLWDHARGHSVHDRFGNRWIDWSSCVLVANAGHAHPRVVERLRTLIDRGQLATYVFAHEERAELVERLVSLAPPGLDRAFLLTTGSEAVECVIKILRAWGLARDGARKVIVSFTGGFHGRTLGSQLAGGIPSLKTWIGGVDPTFVQVPFPDGYLVRDVSFGLFEKSLDDLGIEPRRVAGVLSESYLGIGPDFFPAEYTRELRRWCDEHGALLAFDEVQSGFGRTGRLFAFEHYGVTPDLIACGKGITSSLPLAAVIGRAEVMNTFAPGSMTSTHSGSPLAVAAAIGSIEAITGEGLVEHAATIEPHLLAGLERLEKRWGGCIGATRGRGLVGGIRIVKPGTLDPDPGAAAAVVEACFRRGLLLFAPVGLGGGCVKIAPPLSIPVDALEEGFEVMDEAFDEVFSRLER
ncbi:MAG TPA: aspartate aminotransferase family protein [Planctomycetota bacterium]|nr:aspartate aminotransferase family protein [Planctomycetota bacterium]